jgi:hypothetical protein
MNSRKLRLGGARRRIFGRVLSPAREKAPGNLSNDKKEQNITTGMKGSRETARSIDEKKCLLAYFGLLVAIKPQNFSMLVRVYSACFFLSLLVT